MSHCRNLNPVSDVGLTDPTLWWNRKKMDTPEPVLMRERRSQRHKHFTNIIFITDSLSEQHSQFSQDTLVDHVIHGT